MSEAIKARNDAIEAAIERFRECGVEIERFHIIDHLPSNTMHLCIDGVSRFSVQFVVPQFTVRPVDS